MPSSVPSNHSGRQGNRLAVPQDRREPEMAVNPYSIAAATADNCTRS
jgi:hypothetical protein